MSSGIRENEPVIIHRDVDAVMVPSGEATTLKTGMAGYITQALGGSFTLYVDGNLYRIAGINADAIGKEVMAPVELPPNATADDVRELAWQQMRGCYDPEIPINVVDLGLIYDCTVAGDTSDKRQIDVRMTLTAPGCGMGEVLVADVRQRLLAIPTVEQVNIDLVFDPPWSREMMSEAARLQTGMMW